MHCPGYCISRCLTSTFLFSLGIRQSEQSLSECLRLGLDEGKKRISHGGADKAHAGTELRSYQPRDRSHLLSPSAGLPPLFLLQILALPLINHALPT